VVTGVVIPSLGGRHLAHCLEAVAGLEPAPASIVVVVSGGRGSPIHPAGAELVTVGRRLGFAAAVNAGIVRLGTTTRYVALLNDDAVPATDWLAPLLDALEDDAELAAVQGTVTDSVGAAIDGRGIALDPVGLPIQIDRGGSPAPEPAGPRSVLAVSGTATVFRTEALRAAALADGSVFDPVFGSYHEDLDLGLRLRRIGWRSAWVPGAWVSHVGSVTARRLGWRHPWWVLVNRWRAFAGNLTAGALLAATPRLLRGELRAINTLTRHNPRAPIAAAAALLALPWMVLRGLGRPSPGARLDRLPEV
jgi:GT2 family glycosyltransferase